MMKRYSIGCPVWACDGWVGKIFPKSSKRNRWLKYYSQAFPTVEGNTTFYAPPAVETVQRWADLADPGFRFALKFPKLISHECRLRNCQAETDAWLQCLSILGEANHLGPTFLQLPPDFDGSEFRSLEAYLNALPNEFPWAVEVRHPAYFDGDLEKALNDLLRGLSIDRVIFDSRALFASPANDASEIESRRRKPKSPIRTTVTGKHPFLRFIGRNDLTLVEPWLKEWVPQVAQWIRKGLHPFVFTHAPDDRFAPAFVQLFHDRLQQELPGLEDLSPWPGAADAKQLSLF